MRLYHYEKVNGSAFGEALIDYLTRIGKEVPESLLKGISPEMRKSEHGKPYFSGSELCEIFFSRSHTNETEVVCFAENEVGVDCEDLKWRSSQPGRIRQYEKIAKRHFTEDEQEYIAFGEPLDKERFFDVWTAKEAYTKYTGKGFSEGFQSFSVFNRPDVRIITNRLEGAQHIVCSICTSLDEMPIDSLVGNRGQ